MKITVKRETIKGDTTWEYVVTDNDGKKMARREKYGRGITGHTSESGGGIFSENCDRFYYGAHKNPDFPNYPLFDATDTPGTRADKIIKRIELVRSWVNDCKARDAEKCGKVTVEIPPTVDDLKKRIAELEKKAHKRDAAGRFIKQ